MSIHDNFWGGTPPGVHNVEDSWDFVTYVAGGPGENVPQLPIYNMVEFIAPIPSSAPEDPAYVIPVTGPDDPQAARHAHLPFETRNVAIDQLTPKPCTWVAVTAENIEVRSESVASGFYRIKANIPLEKTNVIVWPEDKQHLKSIAYGLTSNPIIAKAFAQANWEVHWSFGNDTMPELKKYYGILGDTEQPGPGYAIGGYWIPCKGFNCTETVARWLIIDDVFVHLPEQSHSVYRDFACWGTSKGRGVSPVSTGDTPEPPDDEEEELPSDSDSSSKQPQKRVKYIVGGVDLLADPKA